MQKIEKGFIMCQLKIEFENMKNIPMFEIEREDGGCCIYHIIATNHGLEAGGMCNYGFHNYKGLEVPYDDVFSLDEHIQELYELCLGDCN